MTTATCSYDPAITITEARQDAWEMLDRPEGYDGTEDTKVCPYCFRAKWNDDFVLVGYRVNHTMICRPCKNLAAHQ